MVRDLKEKASKNEVMLGDTLYGTISEKLDLGSSAGDFSAFYAYLAPYKFLTNII